MVKLASRGFFECVKSNAWIFAPTERLADTTERIACVPTVDYVRLVVSLLVTGIVVIRLAVSKLPCATSEL